MILKYSKQREAIKAFLMTRYDHPTADVVYTNVRKTFPSISLGTVYRNLTLLSAIGEITRLDLGNNIDHFDANTKPHFHFICQECGSVIDLNMDDNSSAAITGAALQLAAKHFDGQVTGVVTYFNGLCKSCETNTKKGEFAI